MRGIAWVGIVLIVIIILVGFFHMIGLDIDIGLKESFFTTSRSEL